MPQLDALTFLPQFTWFTIVFTLLYLRVTTSFLPKIAETLKVRKQGKEQDIRDRVEVVGETDAEVVRYERVVKASRNATQKAIVGDTKAFEAAVTAAFTTLNETQFGEANETYIEAVVHSICSEYVLQELSNPGYVLAD